MKSPNKFVLWIELGNDAMQSPADVARALRAVADKLAPANWERASQLSSRIGDDNGNKVGEWEVQS